MCTSEWHTPALCTLSSTSVPCGCGVGVSISLSGLPNSTTTWLRMRFSCFWLRPLLHAVKAVSTRAGARQCGELRDGQFFRARSGIDAGIAQGVLRIGKNRLETLPQHLAPLAE